MDAAEGDVLAPMAFPEEHRPRIASTDPLERRADVVDIFPGEGAITRLAGALLLERHDE